MPGDNRETDATIILGGILRHPSTLDRVLAIFDGVRAPFRTEDDNAVFDGVRACHSADPSKIAAHIERAGLGDCRDYIATLLRDAPADPADVEGYSYHLAVVRKGEAEGALPWAALPEDWQTNPPPPRDFVFEGVAPIDCITLFVAQGGQGKSSFALALSLAVASGRPVAGFSPTQTGPVVVLSLEDDMAEIARRVHRISNAYEITPAAGAVARGNLHFLPMPVFEAVRVEGKTVKGGADLQRFKADLADIRPRLVLLDNLAALLSGAVDENGNAEAQAVMGIVRDAMPPGAGILVVAHVAKVDREASTTARGASGWQDSARQVIALRPLDPVERKSVPAGDPATYVALEWRKSNYSAMRPTAYYRREGAGVFRPVNFMELATDARDLKTTAVRAAVPLALAAVVEEGVTRQEAIGRGGKDGKQRGQDFRDALTDAAGFTVGCDVTKTVIDAMLASGELTQHGEGHRKTLVFRKSE